MNDTITQARLALRLDAYLDSYRGKLVHKDAFSRVSWDTAWEAAEIARTKQILTPELVDDVRRALSQL
jgi:hypothetical protein